jgi:hypothetical protein
MTAELPPHAIPGECWAKVWVPPTFKTLTEQVLVREASERIEIIPAKYEWVEERVCVKDASTRLIEEPAEFMDREVIVRVDQGYTDWEVTKTALCTPVKEGGQGKMAQDVFCLVKHPPQDQTINTQRVSKPARVREEVIPAQFETVRRHKLVTPASTRRIAVPAEYETVEKTVKVCDGRMAWQKVECQKPADAITLNIPRTTSE